MTACLHGRSLAELPNGNGSFGLLDHGVVEVIGNNGLVHAVEQDKQGLCEITITRGPSVYHHHL